MALTFRWRSAAAYTTVAALTLILFIALHVAGNRLPSGLAAERLAEELRATPVANWGTRHTLWWFKPAGLLWHYCEFGAAVLAGARGDQHRDAVLREAILLPGFTDGNYACKPLHDAVRQGVRWPPDYLNLRHWWGGKALYAIGLRYLTVRQFHIALEVLVYCGFLSLAIVLMLIGWRALLVAAPVLLSGLWFSGVEFFGTLATGLPFAWALFATALGAELLRRDRQSVARLFLFFAGMVAHYLWLLGGNNFVAATLIGLVAWLAREADSPQQRFVSAAVCVGVYTAGFVVSLASRLVLIKILLGDLTAVTERMAVLERFWSPPTADMVVATYLDLVRVDAPTFLWWSSAAATALLVATLIAVATRRRRPELAFDVLWFAALFLPFCLHMLVPQDSPPRSIRLCFLPLGLAFCCLVAVLSKLPRRQFVAVGAGIGMALVLSYVGVHLHATRKHQAKLAHARVLSDSLEDGAWAVYLLDAPADDDTSGPARGDAWGRELIYRKAPCDAMDIRRGRLFLHALGPPATLPDVSTRQFGWVSADFPFYANSQVFMGTCHAIARLPGYAQGIRTGQSFPLDSQYNQWKTVWQLEIPEI